MHYGTTFVVFFATLSVSVNAARILAIFAFPGPAQYAFVEPLLKELAGRGHHVTSISNFPQKRQIENFRDIVISGNRNLFDEFKNYSMDSVSTNHYDIIDGIYKKGCQMCVNILNNPLVNDLRKNDSFDLILLEVFFTESFFGFGQHFGAPMIGISSVGTMTSIDELVGNTTPLSYIPSMIMLRQYNKNMNFWRRCLNVTIYLVEWVHYYCKYFPIQKKIYELYFPNASMTFEKAQKNFSLVLLNDHFTITTPRPYVPNMIEVAGMHIPPNPNPIPVHLNTLLNAATQGVIYVTIETFPPKPIMQIILNQFQHLPQIVLWTSKFIPSTSTHIPSNVYFTSELCHYSVLSHPHLYLLISHGGYLNIIESIHYGVPILGIPNIDGDKEDYVDNIRKVGNGLSLKADNMNAKSVSVALHDLLDSDRYRIAAKRRSQLFRDQQNTPMERAVYWIEYVLRHKGASHLRNLGQNLTFWEFYNLDVFLCMSFIIAIFICLSYGSLIMCMQLLMKYRKRKYKND